MSTWPPKVLHVAETAKGGISSYIEDIAALQIKHYGTGNVRIVMPVHHAALIDSLPKSSLIGFQSHGAGRAVAMLRMTAVAMNQIRSWQPDIVHLHSTYAGFALRPILAIRRKHLRVIYCAHGWAFDRGRRGSNRIYAAIERIWARWCDAIVCVSQHDLARAREVGIENSQMTLIVNGIADVGDVSNNDIELAKQSWPSVGTRVLFVGRLDQQKGVDILLHAMRIVGCRANAVVIGESVVTEGTALDVPENVRMLGWIPRRQLDSYYKAASVLVMPSRWEAFGLTAIEAMRSGCPVIASKVGGLCEIVDDGVTGLLFDQDADAPKELAKIIDGVSNEYLQSLGAAGRERFLNRFSTDRASDQLDVLYRGVLAGRDSRA